MKCGEDDVAGEGGFGGDLGGLQVADFADEDDVGILAKEGAKDGRELEVDVGVDLRLSDAIEADFDGVFDGGDVDVGVIDLVERGVEGGGLAGAGGAGDEDDAVGVADETAQRLEDVLRDHHLVQREHGALAGHGEDADDRLFAVLGGDGGEAEVGGLGADGGGEASVLGESGFGDVEVGNDLEARDDGAVKLPGVGDDLAEVAVDAEAHAALGFLGLDVDVGGALADGEVDHLVDEGDDGVGVGDGGEFVAG